MFNSFTGLKRILKPLLIALILIVFVFISVSKKKKDFRFSALNVSETTSPQSVFINPNQKSQPEPPEFLFLQKNSICSTFPSFTITPKVLGALVGGFEVEDSERIIIEYVVESGDNLWSIAAKFDISLKTILWANEMSKTTIQPGQKLVIPPVSGVIHHVKDGDIVSQIAKKYKAEIEDIVSFNELSNEADIYIGDILIIPEGEMPLPVTKHVSATWIPVANSYFICPISLPCDISQGLHWYNAIDFTHGKCGESIYAAAGGRVLKVKLTNSTSRWAFGGAGNHITILHLNGVVTMYGHIASSFVKPGDEVYQGQIIALMGGKPGTPGAGMSTGCHVHFGVRGAVNPFAK